MLDSVVQFLFSFISLEYILNINDDYTKLAQS